MLINLGSQVNLLSTDLFEGLETLVDMGNIRYKNSLRTETVRECKEVKVQVEGGIGGNCMFFVMEGYRNLKLRREY